MSNNTVIDNVKRAMAKAMISEILRMIDSNESETITPEEIVAHLNQFMAESPTEKVEKVAKDDAAGLEIKKWFWSFGNISCKNGELLLRDVLDGDKDGYLQLQREYSSLRSLLQEERYCTRIWNDHIDNNSLILSIVKDGEYVGYCGIKDLSKEQWEIAIELLPKWTHQGIGSAVIPAMLDAINEHLGMVDFRVRIDPANFASQGFFEKLGAKPNGISKFILQNEDEIRQCEETNLHLIDAALIEVAEKFHVEPRKLLSHVLEYTLHWSGHGGAKCEINSKLMKRDSALPR